MKVLLVEPNYIARYIPFGLMKISSYLKANKNKVHFVKGRQKINFIPDEIYITTLFTFYYKVTIETILYYKQKFPKAKIKVGGIFASLMPDYIEKYTGIKPHYGLMPEAENFPADYSYFNNIDYSIAFTSRGCIRKCKFCIVPKVEGTLKDVPEWIKYIDVKKPNITFWDNNFFAKGFDNIVKDIETLKDLCKKGIKNIDFNQGLDARLFNEDIVKLISQIPLFPARFAFDNMSEDGHVQKAIELCRKYKITDNKKWDAQRGGRVTVYVLYNFKDTPEDFYYRIREIVKAGATPFPMRYSPFNDLNRKHTGDKWSELQKMAVNNLTSNNGNVSTGTKEEFEYFWGRNAKEFIEIISNPNNRKVKESKLINQRINKIRNLRNIK